MSDTFDEDTPDNDPTPVETRDLTDPRKERRYRDKQKRAEQERASLWRAVLNDRVGRAEIWRLLAVEGRAFNVDFSFGPVGVPDPLASWHNLGRQQFAMRFYHDLLRYDFENVRLMHIEHDSRFMKPKPEPRDRNQD